MRFTENEYRKYIIGTIIMAFILLVLLIGLILYTYRTPLRTGDYIKGRKSNTTTYDGGYTNDGMYSDYFPSNPSPTEHYDPSLESDPESMGLPDPENRKF